MMNKLVISSLTGGTISMPLIAEDGIRHLVDLKLTLLFSIHPMFTHLEVTWS